jgi:uncharacterized protein YdbL (DUF1318 family)
MKRRTRLLIAAGLGLAIAASGSAYAFAMQSAEQLRATGQVGEQADGYMGIVGSAPADVRARVDAINIERRARYTKLAAAKGTTIETAAASTACEIFSQRIQPGQYYRLPGASWQKRQGGEPVPLPSFCG